jgi:hypothetical protein
MAILTVTGPSYTFVLADVGRCVSFTATGAIAAYVPVNGSSSIPVQSQIVTRLASSTGVVTITPNTGVTLNAASLVINQQWTDLVLSQEETLDTWWVAAAAKGATGATGAQGTQGTLGSQGTQGTQGSMGSSAYLPRVTSLATAGSPTPNANTDDIYELTAQSLTAAFQISSGTAENGQYLRIRILAATGATKNITWTDATFGYTAGYIGVGSGPTLPSTMVRNKRTYCEFIYDTGGSINRWILVQRLQST